jgi:hypothetical protein
MIMKKQTVLLNFGIDQLITLILTPTMKLVFISLIILKLHPLIYRIITQATMPMVLFLQFFAMIDPNEW